MTKVWAIVFHHFLAIPMATIVVGTMMMFVASRFCHNFLVAMFICCIFDVL
jgi:hypothetical protein